VVADLYWADPYASLLSRRDESETLVFNSKDEMDDYIAWMQGSSTSKKGKIITLHPKHGDE
jgi:hypothetical protein